MMDSELLQALRTGNVDKLEDLLQSEGRDTTSVEATGTSPMLRVSIDQPTEPEVTENITNDQNAGHATSGQLPMLLRGVTSAGDGALHIAVRHGHEDVVRAIFCIAGVPLVNQTTDAPGARDDQGHQICCILLHASLSICASSCNHPEGNTIRTSTRGGEEVAATMTSRETQVPLSPPPTAAGSSTQCTQSFAMFLRAQNDMGETCLHEAVRWGHTNIVSLLMAVDANPNNITSPALVEIVDNDGSSPLYLATTLRRLDIVKALTVRDYRYSVSQAGPARKTALHAAVLLSTGMHVLMLCSVFFFFFSLSLALSQLLSATNILRTTFIQNI